MKGRSPVLIISVAGMEQEAWEPLDRGANLASLQRASQ